MLRIIKQVADSLGRSPVKSTLTIITVGLGVGVLILVLSMTTSIRNNVETQLSDEGYVLMVANASLNENDQPEPVRPPQFTSEVIDALRGDVEGVVAASPVNAPNWQNFLADNEQFRVRSAVAVNHEYVDVMELDLIAGSYFTEEDVTAGTRYAVVTEGLAIALFGSPDAALGKVMSIPMTNFGGGGGNFARRFTPPSFYIHGVVADPSELMRKSYGIGDLIVPLTAILPAGMNVRIRMDFFYATLAVRIQGVDMETAESQIRESLARTYGDDVEVMVWEGTVRGESTYLAEVRDTISNFALVGNILGFVLLAVASIGIMSIMLVEAIGRSRDIALERALGASNQRIVGEYFTRSVVISLIAAIIGVGFSLVLANPLSSLIAPVFAGFSGLTQAGTVVSASAIGIAVVAAAVLGGIFGTFPVFSVLRTPIAEGLRDV